jgi:hypothetical protein
MSSILKRLAVAICCGCFTLPAIAASDWVIGNVTIVEDYRAYDANMGVLVTLANKAYYGSGGTIPTVCTERFRVVAGQESVTADIQKSALAMLLAAYTAGQKVRLFVNPDNVYSNGQCAVRIVSVGDV